MDGQSVWIGKDKTDFICLLPAFYRYTVRDLAIDHNKGVELFKFLAPEDMSDIEAIRELFWK